MVWALPMMRGSAVTAPGAVSTCTSNIPAPPWVLRVNTASGVKGADADGVTASVADAAPAPIALVAITLQLADALLASPVTVMGEAEPVTLIPPQVAVKLMMAEPPFDAGAENATDPRPSPGIVSLIVGAPGTVAGTTFTVADAAPVPTAFDAVTAHLYTVPLVSPVTLIGDAPPGAEILPGLQVAVKPVMALPPLLAGAVKAMPATVLPAVAVPMTGADGTPTGVTLTGADAAPGPKALNATTLQE